MHVKDYIILILALLLIWTFINDYIKWRSKQKHKDMTATAIKSVVKRHGDGYYFIIDGKNNKILDCFSIAIISKDKVEVMEIVQTIGNPNLYKIEDIIYFIKAGNMFLHISQVHRYVKFKTVDNI
jgi:hypothetical protein